MAFPVFVCWFQGRPYWPNKHGYYPAWSRTSMQGKDRSIPHSGEGNCASQAALPGGMGAGAGRGIKWHNRKARRPFPVSFLTIKSQTPAEVLTPSKYTFPCPWPPLQSDLGLLCFLSGQPEFSAYFGAVWLVEPGFTVDFPGFCDSLRLLGQGAF